MRERDAMIAPDLPAELKAALDARLQGLSRNDAAARAARISQTYRDGGGSGAIRSEADALAYALARMPATYAAVTASLNALGGIKPDFAPKGLLDVGAGPGTATWAAAEAFSSLTDFTLLDANNALRALALDLFHGSSRLSNARYAHREARAALADSEPADLVVASYMIGEVDDHERTALAALMWAKTRDTLLIVEPGTPVGYARILALRAQLIASGAHVAAPCPHDGPCPLIAPDWCHFTQRLPRSQAHRQIKGAEVPYRGREIRLSRADPRAGPNSSRSRAGAARGQQGRSDGEALYGRRRRRCKDTATRQGRLWRRPALALGRCGDGARLTQDPE